MHKEKRYATIKRVKNLKNKRIFLVRMALLFMLGAWMLFIYILSADNGAESEIKSTVAAGWTVKLTQLLDGIFHFRDPERVEFLFHVAVRKTAHLCEFAVLAALWFFFISTFTQRTLPCTLPSAFLSVAYAAFDEYHQTLVPGRSGQVSDVLVDAAGAAIGILCAMLLLHLLRKRRQNAHSMKKDCL